jgi:hypothetical protein
MVRRFLIASVAIVAGGLFAWNFPVRSDRIWIDPITGSMRGRTDWLFFSTPPRLEPSAIERWIIKHEGRYDPDWHMLTRAEKNVLGRTVARGCAAAPAIYPLHAGDLNDRYVSTATDSDIGEFVRVMKEGTGSERERAVEAACKGTIEGRGRPAALSFSCGQDGL